MAAPSHCSPLSSLPLPQLWQPALLKAQPGRQVNVPAKKPSDLQLLPPMAAPSHCSPLSSMPLPQLLQPALFSVQLDRHLSVPLW